MSTAVGKNPELLRTAMANILKNKKLHSQAAWIERQYSDDDGEMCGTTMCLAGWAALAAGAEMPPVLDKDWDGEWHVDKDGKYRTADEYSEAVYYSDDNPDEIDEVWRFASKKLGTDYVEREYLFYFFGNADELAERVEDVATAWESGRSFEY